MVNRQIINKEKWKKQIFNKENNNKWNESFNDRVELKDLPIETTFKVRYFTVYYVDYYSSVNFDNIFSVCKLWNNYLTKKVLS